MSLDPFELSLQLIHVLIAECIDLLHECRVMRMRSQSPNGCLELDVRDPASQVRIGAADRTFQASSLDERGRQVAINIEGAKCRRRRLLRFLEEKEQNPKYASPATNERHRVDRTVSRRSRIAAMAVAVVAFDIFNQDGLPRARRAPNGGRLIGRVSRWKGGEEVGRETRLCGQEELVLGFDQDLYRSPVRSGSGHGAVQQILQIGEINIHCLSDTAVRREDLRART